MSGRALRVLYLADIRFPLERANGIQSMETCHALARRGHQVTLLVRNDTEHPPRDPFAFYGLPPIASLAIERTPSAGPPSGRRAAYVSYAVGRAAGRARQDVLFTRDLGVASLLLRIPATLRAPLVYEAHGIAADVAAAMPSLLTGGAPASPAKLRRLAGRDARVWTRAEGYVSITAALASALERHFGRRDRVAVVPDGVRPPEETEGTAATDRAEPRPFVIGYAGHLYPWKGVELIIEAVTALPDTTALIVGGHEREPDIQRLSDFALSIECRSRVTFTGQVPPREVFARLREADVLVLPNPPSAISTSFTSPLKLFEYMAAERPIVASDLPSIREVLTHERNAILVEAGNPQALTAGIRRVKEDPALASRLARQARADVAAYTWDRRAERLEAIFGEVLA
jgi:glycosyltransferase involved in cell wall biosynthesis